MASRAPTPLICRFCKGLAIQQSGSTHLCVTCRDRINLALNLALELQRNEGLSDAELIERVGISGRDVWRRIRTRLETDPTYVPHTACVRPDNPLLPLPVPEYAYARPRGRWEEHAACGGHEEPDLFHPDPSWLKPHRINKRSCDKVGCDECRLRDRVARAHRLCETCVVRAECRDSSTGYGLWGGVLQKERKL